MGLHQKWICTRKQTNKNVITTPDIDKIDTMTAAKRFENLLKNIKPILTTQAIKCHCKQQYPKSEVKKL